MPRCGDTIGELTGRVDVRLSILALPNVPSGEALPDCPGAGCGVESIEPAGEGRRYRCRDCGVVYERSGIGGGR